MNLKQEQTAMRARWQPRGRSQKAKAREKTNSAPVPPQRRAGAITRKEIRHGCCCENVKTEVPCDEG